MANNDGDFLDWINDISWRQILLHPGLWFLVATCVMIGAAINVWETRRNHLVDVQKFDLGAQQITITNQPTWMAKDLRNVILDEIQSPANLLNEHLVANTARVLEENPWIESVQRVEKGATGLRIDLSYRIPVAVVDFHQSDRRQIPVDRLAVVMDQKITQSAGMDGLMHISVPRPEKTQPETWQVWNDARVQEAAKICAFLNQEAASLELFRVVNYGQRASTAGAQKPYEVWTKNGVKIVWGAAPGQEPAGEASAAEKLQAIQQFVVKEGPLTKMDRRKKIDIQTGTAILVTDVRTANLDDSNLFDELN